MRKGDRLRVTIEDLDQDSAGTVVVGDRVLHVAAALPGDVVTAVVEHVSRHRSDAWARLVRLETRSPVRVEPMCPSSGRCGGCPLQSLRYDEQVGHKERQVAAALAAYPRLKGVHVSPCAPSPLLRSYRNKSKLVYGRAVSGTICLGAYRPRSHELIDLAGCVLVESPLDRVRGDVLAALAEHRVAPYDETQRTGMLRYVILRRTDLGQVGVVFITASTPWPEAGAVAEAVCRRAPEVVSITHSVNPSEGNALFVAPGPEVPPDQTLVGSAVLVDRIGDVTIELSPRSFLQVNRQVAARIYEDVVAGLGLQPTDRVVDLYSGVGAVALHLAPWTAAVVGIEEVPDAVDNARRNAARLGADLGDREQPVDVRFVCGDVAAHVSELETANVVVLNPPRQGCRAPVLEAVAAARPRRLAYISCSAETLARDLDRLVGLGYRVASVFPYDMLPHTPHVELLALLEPAAPAPAPAPVS